MILPHDREKTGGSLHSSSSDNVGESHDGESESRLEKHCDDFGGKTTTVSDGRRGL